MRRILSLVIVLLIAQFCFSQTYGAPNMIIHTDTFMNLIDYQTVDGEVLNNKTLKAMLKAVPGNDKYLYEENAWRAADYTFIGLSLAGISTLTCCGFVDDFKNSETVVGIALGTTIISLAGAIFTGNVATSKRLKAVDNYNVYIMGIPINY